MTEKPELNHHSALLLIDIQEGFDELEYWGKRNNPEAEAIAARVLAFFRSLNLAVFHVIHHSVEADSPLRPELPGSRVKDIVAPKEGEDLISKNVNSAFIGTDLEKRLKNKGINELVIAGLTTDHCVSTTTRMAGNLGFQVYLLADATATFDKVGPDGRIWSAEDLHSSALASLHGEFARVIESGAILSRQALKLQS